MDGNGANDAEDRLRSCSFRTLPADRPAAGSTFNVLLGSCFYGPRDPHGMVGRTFAALPESHRPHVKVLCGDQVYLDNPWYETTFTWYRGNKKPGVFRKMLLDKYLATWTHSPDEDSGFNHLLGAGANYFCSVYRTLKRFIEEGEAGLEDKKRGRPRGALKVDLKAMDAVRRLQKNPGLGEFRVSAALAQVGIHLSPRTCGRILAINRRIYGYEKPESGPKEKKRMPFASGRRHEFWSADIRYIDHTLSSKTNVYVISILENHSRAILGSAITRAQDTRTPPPSCRCFTRP